jgi:F-type H+-transporting ATPase subunit gamma
VLDACKSEEVELPILEVREVKKVSLVVVTGDRGLCGGYNSQIIKQTTKRIAKLNSQGIKVRYLLFQFCYLFFLFIFNSILLI